MWVCRNWDMTSRMCALYRRDWLEDLLAMQKGMDAHQGLSQRCDHPAQQHCVSARSQLTCNSPHLAMCEGTCPALPSCSVMPRLHARISAGVNKPDMARKLLRTFTDVCAFDSYVDLVFLYCSAVRWLCTLAVWSASARALLLKMW